MGGQKTRTDLGLSRLGRGGLGRGRLGRGRLGSRNLHGGLRGRWHLSSRGLLLSSGLSGGDGGLLHGLSNGRNLLGSGDG